jgi:hypothetical protein
MVRLFVLLSGTPYHTHAVFHPCCSGYLLPLGTFVSLWTIQVIPLVIDGYVSTSFENYCCPGTQQCIVGCLLQYITSPEYVASSLLSWHSPVTADFESGNLLQFVS